ncbi:hypothetical protein GE061_008773 [Apolygus lucorum]|uniref:Peptidase S1 domain-containing protein n=1 Tax=Apolygus lucorum TaxID=248454 RepID=A0A8S9WPR5_APOLU|nr:hypothetical protein GE061_008773 [Apolygus lucorum]
MTSFSLTTFLVFSGFVGLIHSWGSESDFLDNDINRADGVTPGPRTKRVIYGLNFKLIDDHVEDFPSLKYFVVISHAHLCSLKLLDDFIDFFAAGSKNVLNVSIPLTANCMMGNRDPRCSGALIAPNIIQTACHCLATFYTVRNTGLDALEKSVWEDHRIVFRPIEDPSFKYRDSFFSQYYTYSSRLALVSERQFMFTKKFYVHQKCSRLARR